MRWIWIVFLGCAELVAQPLDVELVERRSSSQPAQSSSEVSAESSLSSGSRNILPLILSTSHDRNAWTSRRDGRRTLSESYTLRLATERHLILGAIPLAVSLGVDAKPWQKLELEPGQAELVLEAGWGLGFSLSSKVQEDLTWTLSADYSRQKGNELSSWPTGPVRLASDVSAESWSSSLEVRRRMISFASATQSRHDILLGGGLNLMRSSLSTGWTVNGQESFDLERKPRALLSYHWTPKHGSKPWCLLEMALAGSRDWSLGFSFQGLGVRL